MAASESGAYRGVAALPESMHAAVLHAPGDLRYEVVRTPCPRPGHVVVRVAVAGHCGSDLARIMAGSGDPLDPLQTVRVLPDRMAGIRRAGGVSPGGDVLVLGVGSIGTFALQWARVLGADRVIAADVDDPKLDVARQLGADFAVNPARADLLAGVMTTTRGLGAELVIEASGSPEVRRQTLALVRKQVIGETSWLRKRCGAS